MPNTETWYTPDEAAAYLKVARQTLAVWRTKGCKLTDAPPFTKVGRKVLYGRVQLDAWLGRHTHHSTSEFQ